MILVIPDVLDADTVSQVRSKLATMKFVDGAETAGEVARKVKNNLQADMSAPDYTQLNHALLPTIANNPLFERACLPMKFTRLRFSRYRDSMAYGAHIDAPMMGEIRSDVSFTLFLTDPKDYDGGELVMETTAGEQTFKPEAGQMIIYPSTTLHRVEPVKRGERVAAVGWCQSQVRDPAQREILYDLDTARRGVFDKQGKTREFDVLSKAHANLMRMWADV